MPILFTRQLAAIVTAAVRYNRSDRFSRHLHPAARTFQALRILVNDELNELQCALRTAHKLLCPGGRLVVISFHALEDSIVRHFFKESNSEVNYLRSRTKVAGKAKASTWLPLHKKVIYPSDEEVYLNPRSRSAKLRAAAKADNLVLDLTELTNLLNKNPGQTFYNGTSPVWKWSWKSVCRIIFLSLFLLWNLELFMRACILCSLKYIYEEYKESKATLRQFCTLYFD